MNKQQIKENFRKVMNDEEITIEETKILIRDLASVNIVLEDEFIYNEEESPKENLLRAIENRIDFYFRIYWGA